MSLSARRAWIEIYGPACCSYFGRPSLSARRAWIEIIIVIRTPTGCVSLSARRAWIEMTFPGFGVEIDGGRSPQGERG